MNKVIKKINQKEILTKEDLVVLLQLTDFSEIYQIADNIRKNTMGDYIDMRAILEFSNHCRRRCQYCGLNRDNKKIKRYRMTHDEIVETTLQAAQAGYKTIVLQSGEDPYYSIDKLTQIIKAIRSRSSIHITMSCGELSLKDYRLLREAGADRYLLKHETADPIIFDKLHPCGTLNNRIQCLKTIHDLNFETGSGFMIGLPGQTLETIASDILLLQELDCQMAGIGPFIPSPNTVLRNQPKGSTELTKRAVALTRILLPKSNLPATTSLGVIDSSEKNNVFQCGANVIMRKVTPQKYEQYYSIYPSDIEVHDIKKEKTEIENLIWSLGRIPR